MLIRPGTVKKAHCKKNVPLIPSFILSNVTFFCVEMLALKSMSVWFSSQADRLLHASIGKTVGGGTEERNGPGGVRWRWRSWLVQMQVEIEVEMVWR